MTFLSTSFFKGHCLSSLSPGLHLCSLARNRRWWEVVEQKRSWWKAKTIRLSAGLELRNGLSATDNVLNARRVRDTSMFTCFSRTALEEVFLEELHPSEFSTPLETYLWCGVLRRPCVVQDTSLGPTLEPSRCVIIGKIANYMWAEARPLPVRLFMWWCWWWWWWWWWLGGFFLACEDFWRMFDNSFSAYAFFFP